MPKKSYALTEGGQKELEMSWGIGWNDFTIMEGERLIGTVPTQAELKEGRSFRLKDGSELSVKLNLSFFNSGLEVLRNGAPLPGSTSDPGNRIKTAYILLLLVAFLNVFAGVLIITAGISEILIWTGAGYLGSGFAFLILALSVKRGSFTALLIAIILLAVDMGLSFIFSYGTPVVWISRIIVLLYLVMSIRVFKEYSAENPGTL